MTANDLQYDDPIPDDEFVLRYCRGNRWKLRSNGRYRIKAGAFKSGSEPLADISVNWMGYYGDDDNISLNKVCKYTTYNGINKDGKFVKLNTTDIRKIHIESLSGNLDIRYRPERNDKNPSHADICPSGDAIFKGLARLANEKGVVLEVPEKYRK